MMLVVPCPVFRLERPGRKSVNIAMGACARAGRWEEAVYLLRTMEDRGLEPDIYSYNTAMNACARAGKEEGGRHATREERWWLADRIHMWYRGLDGTGQNATALDLLREMPTVGLKPDVVRRVSPGAIEGRTLRPTA